MIMVHHRLSFKLCAAYRALPFLSIQHRAELVERNAVLLLPCLSRAPLMAASFADPLAFGERLRRLLLMTAVAKLHRSITLLSMILRKSSRYTMAKLLPPSDRATTTAACSSDT